MTMISNPAERCIDIMKEIAPDLVISRRVGHCIKLKDGAVRMIYLWHKPERGAVELAMMPADTISQARQFYSGVDKARLLKLQDDGWKMKSNMHFSHFDTHYHWSENPLEMGKYLDYWLENLSQIKKVKKDPVALFNPYFDGLQEIGLINKTDREKLDSLFNLTRRSSLNPCPGIRMELSWPLETAEKMDREGTFTTEVRDRIRKAFSTWNQNFTV